MDPVTLAPAVLTLLLPYLAKAGEKVAEKIGESLPQNAEKLWTALLQKFTRKDVIDDLLDDPADGDVQAAFRLQLMKALAEDPEFLATLTGLLESARQEASSNSATAGDRGMAVNIGGSVRGNIVIGNNNTVHSPAREL